MATIFHPITKLSTLILLVVASATAGAAEIYRWTDAHGVVHFSDEPPADGSRAEVREIRPTNPAGYDPLDTLKNEQALFAEASRREKRDASPPPTEPIVIVIERPVVDRPEPAYYVAPVFYPARHRFHQRVVRHGTRVPHHAPHRHRPRPVSLHVVAGNHAVAPLRNAPPGRYIGRPGATGRLDHLAGRFLRGMHRAPMR